MIALWLQISFVEMAILILTITIVWMAEFINAAVEAAINISQLAEMYKKYAEQ